MRWCKVLVVEDEVPMREQLRLFPWRTHAFEWIGEAKNGLEALTIYEEKKPDIVLTDIAMPFMDGLELMRQLKSVSSDVQIILLTCHNQFDYVREALLLGACDYLMKGAYRDEDLVEALNRARGRLGKTAGPEEPHRYEVQQAIQYIEEHLHLPISLNEAASHVGLSPNYFGIVFRRDTGSYFQDYVKKLRMDQAAFLLKNSSLKIYEIAERVGILNYRYFTDVFTKHFGTTPRDYRGSGA
ncbi:Helix-turn-helix domain-containing protein [Paenibacillus sp. UNCCL117]|uniref:response regulator transcription factor n=1 Tax=unclassified Paenibacillus TaxID=185978 RepID=UPI000882C64E|nr:MULTISPECIES: response regulator [unclassified Paenibacillus]SDD02962.1 Helix-turn-helix domain-containing protein [Paenibacillus sp. cl123]SFW32394.1 Helix-turn-helix domain-containing protein [Paenibacillus sp. UNCCL117]